MVQEVEFVWKGPASKVLLSGDFVNWDSQLELEKTGTEGWFVIKQVCCSFILSVSYLVFPLTSIKNTLGVGLNPHSHRRSWPQAHISTSTLSMENGSIHPTPLRFLMVLVASTMK